MSLHLSTASAKPAEPPYRSWHDVCASLFSADTSISRTQSLLVISTAGDLKTLAIKRLIDRYWQTSSKFGQIVMHHIAYFWHKFI